MSICPMGDVHLSRGCGGFAVVQDPLNFGGWAERPCTHEFYLVLGLAHPRTAKALVGRMLACRLLRATGYCCVTVGRGLLLRDVEGCGFALSNFFSSAVAPRRTQPAPLYTPLP